MAAGHVDRRAVVPFRLKLFGETGKDDRDVRLLRLFDRLGGQGVVHLVHTLYIALRIFRFVAERTQRVPGVIQLDRVDDARTGALIARFLRHLPDDGDRLVLGHGQDLVVVLHQDHRAFRRLLSDFVIALIVALVLGVLERRLGFEHEIDDAVDHFVQLLLFERAVGDRRLDLGLIILARRGHLEVGPRLDAGHPVHARAPVGDDEALEAPFVAEHLLLQPLVLRAILAVEAVVRVHDRPRLSLFDRDLVLSEIDFAQRALVGALVDDHAERLLRVDREVFERRADALGLNAVYECCGALARKIGVFGVVLEVAAAQRRTLDVGTGTEQHGYLFSNALVRDRAAHLERDLGIPRAGDRRRRRHAGRRHGVAERSALFLFVLLVFFVVLLAQTVRSVSQHDRRQAVLFERLCGPIIFAADDVRLFVQSHLGDDFGMLHSFPPRPVGHF